VTFSSLTLLRSKLLL